MFYCPQTCLNYMHTETQAARNRSFHLARKHVAFPSFLYRNLRFWGLFLGRVGWEPCCSCGNAALLRDNRVSIPGCYMCTSFYIKLNILNE